MSLKCWKNRHGPLDEPGSFLIEEGSLVLVSELVFERSPELTEEILVLMNQWDFLALSQLSEEAWQGEDRTFLHHPLYRWVILAREDDLSQLLATSTPFARFLASLDSFFFSPLTGTDFVSRWYGFWRRARSESLNVHGTLMNVFGVGVLLVGDSGIGKSEAAYGLLRRGHSLVCDDAVKVVHAQFFAGKLLGFPAETALQGFMEVKGVGIVNVIAMHGVAVLQDYSRIDMVVELLPEPPENSYSTYEVLGVSLPKIFLEIKGHQDWVSLLESVILNNKLKLLFDYDAVVECDSSQRDVIRRKSKPL